MFGLVAPGYQMAQVAAARAAGDSRAVVHRRRHEHQAQADGRRCRLARRCALRDARTRALYAFVDERKQVYKKLVVNDDGTRLLGGILVGDADDYGTLAADDARTACAAGASRRPDRAARRRRGEAAGIGVAALPATAQICSCNNVTKGAICAAIDAGCTTLGALKKRTKAATLLRRLRAAGHADPQGRAGAPRRRGQQPSLRALPLFAPGAVPPGARRRSSRPSTTCSTKHGTRPGLRHLQAGGRVHPGLVLERVRAASATRPSLQDTNDYFLANMQKDGTYSVVPRMPGGEITPDKLIVIGAGREEVRPVHQDHRRPAHRPVRRAGAPAAADLAGADRRRASNPATPTARRCAP